MEERRKKIRKLNLVSVYFAYCIFAFSVSVFASSAPSKKLSGDILGRYLKKKEEVASSIPNSNKENGAKELAKEGKVVAEDSGPAEIAGANKTNQLAAQIEQENIAAFKANQEKLKKKAEEQLRAAEREAKAQAEKAASQRIAAEEKERNKRLVQEARSAVESGKQVPTHVLEQVKDKKVQDSLLNVAVAQELRQEQKEKEQKSALNLAQLLQMAAVTMQAATAMNSMDGTSPAQGKRNFDPTKAVAPKAALANRSPASLGDKENTISEKSAESETAASGDAKEKSAKDKETLAKIKAEVEAAEKRKKIHALRLKQKLREKANAQGKGAVDTDQLFGGSLIQGEEGIAAGDQAEEEAAKESALSVSSVYQAAREGFSLAGAETDREVGEIVAEAERDLSSEDMSAGVLGRESPSLFVRVHAVHQACHRQNCVMNR